MSHPIDSITRELIFKAPVERVWAAITAPEEVRQWFGSDAQFELQEGHIGYLEWEEECEGRFAMKIVSVDTPHYFAWRWMAEADTPYADEASTLVEWRLESTKEGGTRLFLTESGFMQTKSRDMNIEGWMHELHDLTLYLAD